MGTLIIILVLVVFLSPLVRAYAERISRPALGGNAEAELVRLREEMDRLSAQVARLQDEQQFLTRLLEAGPHAPAPAPERQLRAAAEGGAPPPPPSS